VKSLLTAAVVILGLIGFSLIKVVQSQQGNSQESGPVVDYAAIDRDLENAHLRILRGGRYDRRGAKPIEELPAGIEPLLEIDHSLSKLSALPVEKSDAVLTGVVVSAKAYLSNNKTGIYSEFNISVESVFKDEGCLLGTSYSVVVDREGGTVRFPSGRLQRYGVLGQGTPMVGHRYALFLRRSEESQTFSILTAYELRENHVFPLDAMRLAGSKNTLAFSEYEGSAESVFLSALKEALAQAAKTSTQTRR
jgi:hypothetical protein